MEKTRTSKPSWQRHLSAAWRRLQRTDPPGKLAILGIGQELRGDDAAGVLFIRQIKERLAPTPGVLLIEAGSAPENFSGPLRRFQPDLVLFVDAAEMEEEPGEIRWINWRDTEGFSGSTHTLPPHLLAGFLVAELGCQVALLGIQSVSLEMGDPLSAPVAAAVEKLTGTFTRLSGKYPL